MSPSPSSPNAADLQQAPSSFPDGPNVAPSAHEHEAAQGQVPRTGPTSDDKGQEPPAGQSSRDERIRLAAYTLFEQRGRTSGGALSDWLEAERQIDRQGP